MLRGIGRLGGGSRGRAGGHSRGGHGRDRRLHIESARDANLEPALLDLDLGKARLVEQLRELPDQALFVS